MWPNFQLSRQTGSRRCSDRTCKIFINDFVVTRYCPTPIWNTKNSFFYQNQVEENHENRWFAWNCNYLLLLFHFYFLFFCVRWFCLIAFQMLCGFQPFFFAPFYISVFFRSYFFFLLLFLFLLLFFFLFSLHLESYTVLRVLWFAVNEFKITKKQTKNHTEWPYCNLIYKIMRDWRVERK